MRLRCAALALFCWVTSTARGEYMASAVYQLAVQSDLVLVGSISAVDDDTYVLNVEDVVVGTWPDKTIEIRRLQDWACSKRWKPYEVGQRQLVYLQRPGKDAPPQEHFFHPMSPGSEGEWEITGNNVAAPALYGIPGGPSFPLAEVLDAVRSFRPCIRLNTEATQGFVIGIEIRCEPGFLIRYRHRSSFHEYLVGTAVTEMKRLRQVKRRRRSAS